MSIKEHLSLLNKKHIWSYSRSTFSAQEASWLDKYGVWCMGLELGILEPITRKQFEFVSVAQGHSKPNTKHEILWIKYQSCWISFILNYLNADLVTGLPREGTKLVKKIIALCRYCNDSDMEIIKLRNIIATYYSNSRTQRHPLLSLKDRLVNSNNNVAQDSSIYEYFGSGNKQFINLLSRSESLVNSNNIVAAQDSSIYERYDRGTEQSTDFQEDWGNSFDDMDADDWESHYG